MKEKNLKKMVRPPKKQGDKQTHGKCLKVHFFTTSIIIQNTAHFIIIFLGAKVHFFHPLIRHDMCHTFQSTRVSGQFFYTLLQQYLFIYYHLFAKTAFSVVKSRLASLLQDHLFGCLFVCHHAEMAVDCASVITFKGKQFFSDQT